MLLGTVGVENGSIQTVCSSVLGIWELLGATNRMLGKNKLGLAG